MALPLETLNFVLDVLFILHEISREQHKRAKMSAKERSQKQGLSDTDLLGKKFETVPDDKNTLITALRSGEVVSFKKAQICKVVKEVSTFFLFILTSSSSPPSHPPAHM